MHISINKDNLICLLTFAECHIIRERERQDQLGGFKKSFLDKMQKEIDELKEIAYEEDI